MPFVFAGIVPHPTILIPNIGKENTVALEQTRIALEKIEQELYITKPQKIIILTPHEGIFEDAFSVNAHTPLHSHFETFGDMATAYTWNGSPELAANIQHKTRSERIPTRLVSNELLGHGASVPLSFLTLHLKDADILPIGYSNLDTQTHITFGHAIKEVIMESNKRIAVIASGDMAHTLTKNSPAEFHMDGEWFDSEILSLLRDGDISGLQSLNTNRIQNAHECLYKSLLILSGILGNIRCDFRQYAYEAPFGVGYLTGQFHL